MSGEFVLAGYLRFVESDEPGVVAQVVSKYRSDLAEPSDVPIYRQVTRSQRTVTKGDLDHAVIGRPAEGKV